MMCNKSSHDLPVEVKWAQYVGHWKQDDVKMVYVGRGPGGRDMTNTDIGEKGWLGNPYALSDGYSRRESVEQFQNTFVERLRSDSKFAGAVAGLAGKRLGCWCQRYDEKEEADLCHGMVIAKYARILADRAD